MRPGDGSDGATIPIAPGSTLIPPERLAREPDQQPIQFFPIDEMREYWYSRGRAVDARNAPGVTILLLNGKSEALSSRAKGTDFVYDDIYRLYGLTGATS